MGMWAPSKVMSEEDRLAIEAAINLKMIREAQELREAIDAVKAKTATPEQIQIVLAHTLGRVQAEASVAAINASLASRPNC